MTATSSETYNASGALVSRVYYDSAGQPITAGAFAAANANQATVSTALAQALTDLQAILDTADVPAGTLTTAQLSNFVRAAQAQLKTVALIEKRAIRLLTGDLSAAN